MGAEVEVTRDGPGGFGALIAAKTTESWQTIPHFFVSREIEAEAMLATVDRVRAGGTKITVTDVLLRALAAGLREAAVGDGDDVGLAVATDRGVVLPIVGNVLSLGWAELAQQRAAAVERARSGRLSAADLSSIPASTLSNLGAFGVDHFTGIIAAGQPTLLSVGRIKARAAVDEAGQFTASKTMWATLNIDHRALDGSDAGQALAAFAAIAEDEQRLEDCGG